MQPLHVVIPTFNRCETLVNNLIRLNSQTLQRSLFSVTVVDDGSHDGTLSEVERIKKNINYDLNLIVQANQGAANARNKGIFSRESRYLLSIGDDIFPQRDDFFSCHYEALQNSNQKTVFIGFTSWHPDLPYSRFRNWLINGGPQNDFRGLKNGQSTDFWHFYTGNLSMPTSLFEKELFDRSFKGYGWEDIELGYRLVKNHGCRIEYLSHAKAWHFHQVEERDLWERAASMKEGAKIFESKHPEIRLLPKGLKKILIRCAMCYPIPNIFGAFKKEWEWYIRFKGTTL